MDVIDDFTQEYLAIEVDSSMSERRVVDVLERLQERRGLSISIVVDNGPEFVSKGLDEWTYGPQLQLRFIESGKPRQNAYIESLNGNLRDACLNERWFLSVQHARQVIADWRREYNGEQPHSSLGYLTQNCFTERFLIADFVTVSD